MPHWDLVFCLLTVDLSVIIKFKYIKVIVQVHLNIPFVNKIIQWICKIKVGFKWLYYSCYLSMLHESWIPYRKREYPELNPSISLATTQLVSYLSRLSLLSCRGSVAWNRQEAADLYTQGPAGIESQCRYWNSLYLIS